MELVSYLMLFSLLAAMAPHVGLGEIFKGVALFIVSDFVRLALLTTLFLL
ncbi:hypothetical protein MKP05_19950 [Halomonas sp. EGI 63088]|uniref:Uncharacterized protein n=1 Tax=Halomonas flagellata TaxID=2920385 RepID=A0ABS9RZV9_9GAMM|nr:hypothetical protein [Halomonas flagellata]MCH4565377.1 hypothetical protein [Halomonas flagellata]